VKGDPLPAEDYVARHCRNKNLILTNGEPTGVSESTFELKPDESDGLSANWLEFFGDDRQHNIAGVRSVTKLTVKRSHRIAILNVGAITTAAGAANLRVALAPDTNAAQVLIKEPARVKDHAVRDALAFV